MMKQKKNKGKRLELVASIKRQHRLQELYARDHLQEEIRQALRAQGNRQESTDDRSKHTSHPNGPLSRRVQGSFLV